MHIKALKVGLRNIKPEVRQHPQVWGFMPRTLAISVEAKAASKEPPAQVPSRSVSPGARVLRITAALTSALRVTITGVSAPRAGNVAAQQNTSTTHNKLASDTVTASGAIVASETLDMQRGLLLSLSPGRRTYRMAQAAAGLSVVVLVAALPYAKVQWGQLPSFVPIYESALILNDVITAVLLFGQFAIAPSRAMLALASGYLFTAAMALGHMLTFPGLFAPAGLLGAGPQSTAWIYMFWHAGFPLFVMAYAVLKTHEERTPDRFTPHTLTQQTMACTIAAVLVAAALCVALATAGEHWLPAIMAANRYTPAMWMVAGTTWCLCVATLAVLWHSRPHLTLDVWLMVVLCVWICDVALSAVFNGGRYDVGFYIGRVFGLLGASFVLLLLLIENSVLHSQLAAARAEIRRLAANKAPERGG